MALTENERKLLARLDERTRNTWRSVEKIEEHIVEQNGKLNKLYRNFWLLVGVLVGSGVIGTSIWGVLSTPPD